ncbi:MAG: DUF2442 domain-containing protein [Candidatus Competibacteraceae bacterium]|nr:DUF2442 domain-containing protein [Candidatus Competibacteraceae bacterium]
MIEVRSVEALSGYELALTFNSGERLRFDMRPYLRYRIFRRLENPGYFALARVDYGAVTWPGDIDIAPETLYERSVPWA